MSASQFQIIPGAGFGHLAMGGTKLGGGSSQEWRVE